MLIIQCFHFSLFSSADFFVQTLDCSEDLKLIEKYMKINNEEQVISQSNESPNNNYYQPNCDNALALIGKNNYQFHVEILRINIQPPTDEGICTDYLQLYDGKRYTFVICSVCILSFDTNKNWFLFATALFNQIFIFYSFFFFFFFLLLLFRVRKCYFPIDHS